MGYYEAAVANGSPFVAVGDYITTDSSVTVKAAGGAATNIYIQKFVAEVYTAAAQTVTFGDGTTTVKFSGNTAGTHTFDFGPLGVRFAANTALTLSSTAGPGVSWIAYGYIKSGTRIN